MLSLTVFYILQNVSPKGRGWFPYTLLCLKKLWTSHTDVLIQKKKKKMKKRETEKGKWRDGGIMDYWNLTIKDR